MRGDRHQALGGARAVDTTCQVCFHLCTVGQNLQSETRFAHDLHACLIGIHTAADLCSHIITGIDLSTKPLPLLTVNMFFLRCDALTWPVAKHSGEKCARVQKKEELSEDVTRGA